MTTLNISLPEDVRALADEQVSSGRYASVSEYVASLIRADLNREGDPAVELKLRQRLSAGPGGEMLDRDFDAIRNRVEHQISRRRQP